MLKNNKGFKKFLIIIAIFIVIGGLSISNAPTSILGKYLKNDYISVLYIEGVISEGESGGFMSGNGYNHNYILSQINHFIDDEKNKGLIIYVNSPGGSIFATDEVYLKLIEYKNVTGRPVYISMGSMAASGGYYISVTGDKVFANRNTLTGSIGVTLGVMYDISEFLENHGIKTVALTAGKNKSMGDITQPMNEERMAIFQSILNESYDQFVEVICTGRELEGEAVRTLADGRIYTAKQALNLKLVDEIGTLDDTINSILYDYNLQECDILYYRYEDNSFFSKLSGLAELGQYQNDEISNVLRLLDNRHQIPMAYLCNWN